MLHRSSGRDGTIFGRCSSAIRLCLSSRSKRRRSPMDKTPLDVESGEIQRRTRRSLLIAGAATAIGGGVWRWLHNWSPIDGLNAPFPRILDFYAPIPRGLFREGASAPEDER